MGFLRLVNSDGLALEVPDDILGSVFAAALAAHERGDFVSLCSFDPEEGRYVQVDVSLFIPEHGKLVDESHVMYLGTLFTGGKEIPADHVLVDEILHLMEETDGCIVLSREDDLVLEPEAAKRLILGARRINPFEDVFFPFPDH